MLPYIAYMDPMGNIPYKLCHVETAFSGACLSYVILFRGGQIHVYKPAAPESNCFIDP